MFLSQGREPEACLSWFDRLSGRRHPLYTVMKPLRAIIFYLRARVLCVKYIAASRVQQRNVVGYNAAPVMHSAGPISCRVCLFSRLRRLARPDKPQRLSSGFAFAARPRAGLLDRFLTS